MPITFARQASAAVVLVMLTLSLQCGGMAAVIAWARPSFAPHVLKLGAIRSAMLMMRLMTAFIGLRLLDILLWTCFFSLALFSIMGIFHLLLDKQLCHRWLWRCRSSSSMADVGSGGKRHRRTDVRVVGELPVRHREQASRP